MSRHQDNCLPPAVLQINNQECPTLFHRVTIPAEIGDDKAYPPKPGLYRNTLLVYEANGHVYMFSSDGIPTLISDGSRGIDDYNELTNKPSIDGHELIDDSSLEDIGVTDAIEEALEDYTPTSDFAEVAFSGDYDDLENTPTPPVTHFYRRGTGGIDDPFPFYNDAGFTDQATYQQFEDAILSGPVQILHEYDVAAYMVGNVDMMTAETGYNVAFWVSGEKERQVFRWMYTDSAPVLESVESYSYQPDWNVSNPNSFAYIRNKPTIPAAQVNSDWNANSGVAQILNKPSLATVATSGDYDDLVNKPAPMTVDSALSWTSQNPVENQTIRNAIYVKNSSNDKEAGINIAFSDPTLTPYVHLGSKTSATKGINSVGIGNNAEASAVRSVAIGNSATASKREGVALGPNATAGQYSLSIGYYTETVPNYSTAVGPYAKVLTGATNATAIGYQSEASEAETVSVGKSTNKRRIVNVADGTTTTDAATVGQLNTAIASITPNNIGSADWSALWQ